MTAYAPTHDRPPRKADPDTIVALHRAGNTTRQIAEQSGIDMNTVRRWLRRMLGDEWQPRIQPITQEQIERINLLARDGVPDAWIAEDVGLSNRSVADYRRAAGIELTDDWKIARLVIQHRPNLFDLHLQFAPAATRRG